MKKARQSKTQEVTATDEGYSSGSGEFTAVSVAFAYCLYCHLIEQKEQSLAEQIYSRLRYAVNEQSGAVEMPRGLMERAEGLASSMLVMLSSANGKFEADARSLGYDV